MPIIKFALLNERFNAFVSRFNKPRPQMVRKFNLVLERNGIKCMGASEVRNSRCNVCRNSPHFVQTTSTPDIKHDKVQWGVATNNEIKADGKNSFKCFIFSCNALIDSIIA